MKKLYLLLLITILANNIFSQDWKWLNPTPSGQNLNCVKFANTNIGYAVGNHGTMLKTDDGGLTWYSLKSNTIKDLFSISIIDKDTLYVCGRDLSVFKTTNGGQNWENILNAQYSSYSTNIISFINPSTGYAAGEHMELYKTNNYGKTWEQLNTSQFFQQITSLYFIDENTWYLSKSYSGSIFKTTDGGATWDTLSIPLDEVFLSITFVNENIGYVSGRSGAIIKTTDGGNNWVIQNQASTGLTLSNLLSINFYNDSIGFCVGSSTILSTQNGGTSWDKIQLNHDLTSVYCIDSIHSCVVGGDLIYDRSIIYTSNDGGINWDELSNNITTNSIRKIRFLNDSIGFAIGGGTGTYSGFIIKTINAGNSWDILNTSTDTYPIYDIAIVDSNIIYTIGSYGQVLKTNDGGNTWIELDSQTNENLSSILFTDSITGYISVSNGHLLKTINGGNTWEDIITGVSNGLNSLFFLNKDTGYAITYNSNVDSTVFLNTVDAGNTWNINNIGASTIPIRITFINQDTGFIAGTFGAIYKTINGGNDWTKTYHNGNNYYDIFFTNDSIGYAIGEDGEISKTEDCGENWYFTNNSQTENILFSGCFTDINTGYVVGSGGVILKTTNGGLSLYELNQTNYTICENDTINISPNFIGGKKPITFLWDNSSQSREISVSPNDDTTYYVSIIDAEDDTLIVPILVNVNLTPTPTITIVNDTIFSDILYGNRWYRNDTLVGFYSNYIIPDVSGDYYCIIENGNCYSDTSNILFFEVGIEDYFTDNKIKIYPCPTNNYLVIETPNNIIKQINIYNSIGTNIYLEKTNEKIVKIDVSSLKDGLYYIKLNTKKGKYTKKLIIKSP